MVAITSTSTERPQKRSVATMGARGQAIGDSLKASAKAAVAIGSHM